MCVWSFKNHSVPTDFICTHKVTQESYQVYPVLWSICTWTLRVYIKGWALELSPTQLVKRLSSSTHTRTTAHITTPIKMPADYNGRWEMVSNENFEDVMKALGKSRTLPTHKSMHLTGVEMRTLARGSSEKKESWVP